MKNEPWIALIGIALICCTLMGTIAIMEYAKTSRIALQNGFSNSIGWRK